MCKIVFAALYEIAAYLFKKFLFSFVLTPTPTDLSCLTARAHTNRS